MPISWHSCSGPAEIRVIIFGKDCAAKPSRRRRGMTEQPSGSAIVKFIGPPISAAAGMLISWLTARSTGALGPALMALLSLLGGICGVALMLIYRRYVGVLGADRRRPAERRAYDALRTSLEGGNPAARLYAQWLSNFLDVVDRFFGDVGMADHTLFPHAFGLRTPAPLWTTSSLDRCLLIALVYPVATIFVIWAVSGHVGLAEAALGVGPYFSAWQRAIALAAAVVSIIAWQRALLPGKFGTGYFLVAVLANFVPYLVGITSLSIALTFCFIVTGGIFLRIVLLNAAGMFLFILTTIFFWVIISISGWMITIALGVLFLVSLQILYRALLKHRQRKKIYIVLFLPAAIITCLVSASCLSSLRNWNEYSPPLLFVSFLALINAPFDWASLGLTRALLRRGLELGGWWPYILAVVDAVFAVIIVVPLALTMVIGVQAFDDLANSGGGSAALPLFLLFTGIQAHPTGPEYWWVYALVLSTMIPSLANLMIGGTSLARGLPGLPSLLLRFIPPQGNVPRFDRAWIATALAAQVATGAVLGIAAQLFLLFGIIDYLLPLFGLELFDVARGVAAFNLPLRLLQFFTPPR